MIPYQTRKSPTRTGSSARRTWLRFLKQKRHASSSSEVERTDVPDLLFHEAFAGATDLHEEPEDRVAVDAGHALGGADRIEEPSTRAPMMAEGFGEGEVVSLLGTR